jgi:hypothetical protein
VFDHEPCELAASDQQYAFDGARKIDGLLVKLEVVMNTPVLARCPANAHRMLELLVDPQNSAAAWLARTLSARPESRLTLDRAAGLSAGSVRFNEGTRNIQDPATVPTFAQTCAEIDWERRLPTVRNGAAAR